MITIVAKITTPITVETITVGEEFGFFGGGVVDWVEDISRIFLFLFFNLEFNYIINFGYCQK